jgi:hypothetical protein
LAALFYLVSFSLVFAKDEMTSSLLIGNPRIDIMIEGGTLRMPAKDLFLWVKSAAESATAYYGRFPVPQVLIRIALFEGRGVRNGMTFGDRGGRITIRLGNETVPAELASDWMLTHEMVHLAFPSWIERGGSAIIGPDTRYVLDPVFDREELLVSDLDLTQIDREKMTFDVSGHYARPDLFRFERKNTDAR